MSSNLPNVLLITVDCLRYDRCGFNGSARSTTPFLDSLAKESYIFDNAYATGPYTPESFPGILAGLHSKDVKYSEDLICKAIPREAPTLAGYLSKCGYQTRATVTNTHLSKNRNFDKGFQEYHNIRINQSASMEERRSDSSAKIQQIKDNLFDYFREKINSQERYPNPYVPLLMIQRYIQLRDWPTVSASRVTKKYSKKYSPSTSERPLFDWIHLMDLHAPLHPGRAVRDQGGSVVPNRINHFLADSSRISGIYHPRYGKLYDSALRYVDAQIEELVRIIKREDEWDNTVIIITGDHGEALGERGIYEHPWHYMYDELLKVPLLTRVPGGGSGRIRKLFSLAWLHELITEIIGVNQAPLLASSRSGTHLDEGRNEKEVVVSDSLSQYGYSAGIRDDQYKLIKHTSGSIPEHLAKPSSCEQLFKFRLDPGERSPIKNAPTPHLNDVFADYVTSPEELSSLGNELTQGAEDQLKQLGYL